MLRDRAKTQEWAEVSRIVRKGLKRERYRKVFSFFCPNCSVSRRIPLLRHPFSRDLLIQLTVATAFLTLIFWNLLEWKGVLSLLPLAVGYEVVHRFRLRMHLRCKDCGFDPYIYALDTQWAREEVVNHWREKFKKAGRPYPGDPVVENPAEVSNSEPQSEAAVDTLT